MSIAVSTRLLNPGEVEAIVRGEKDRRRLLRLDQVRSRSRENSSRVLLAVKNERRRQLQLLRQRLEDEWRTGRREQLDELGAQYGQCLLHVGEAHRAVAVQTKKDVASSKDRQKLDARASTRGRDALAKLSAERAQVHQRLLDRSQSRELVRDAEDERAKQLASLPLPPSTLDTSTAEAGLQSETSAAPVALTSHDVTDARDAARAEEGRQRSGDADRRQREAQKQALEKKRFEDAHAKMALQKKYNRIMDELEKIGEAEKLGSQDDDVIIGYDPDAKRRLMAEQEAVVEELLNRLSIPIVRSVGSVESSVCTTLSTDDDDDESCVVNHIFVSVDDSFSKGDSKVIKVPVQKDIVQSSSSSSKDYQDENSSDSTTELHFKARTAPLLQWSPLMINGDETILASHPNGYVSSVGIDLTSYAFDDDQSSSKWPQSTDVESSQTLRSSSEDDDVVFLPAQDKQDVEVDVVEEPVFRNVEIVRHAIDDEPRVEGRLEIEDKSSYLRRLLRLALKNRGDQKADGKISKVVTSARSRSPIAKSTSGLADLKEAFRKAQANLRSELETRGKRMDELLVGDDAAHGLRPLAALSTIMEVESSIDPESPGQWPSALQNEKGIMDEPDLTLVWSEESSRRNTPPHKSSSSSSSLKAAQERSDRFLISSVQSGTSSKLWTPSLTSSADAGSSSTDSCSSCLSSNRQTVDKQGIRPAALSTFDLSESTNGSTLRSVATAAKSQKSICLSHFFQTSGSSDEQKENSCPICQSSISGSDNNALKVSSWSQSSSTCDDSLNSFLKHEMSANNGSFSIGALTGSSNSNS